jgi:ferredoxin
MATFIDPTACISCSCCEPVCPNNAITDGSENPEVSQGVYWINPSICNECVGSSAYEECEAVCPVENCIFPDPNRVETEEVLIERGLRIHAADEEYVARIASGNFPSLKRK